MKKELCIHISHINNIYQHTHKTGDNGDEMITKVEGLLKENDCLKDYSIKINESDDQTDLSISINTSSSKYTPQYYPIIVVKDTKHKALAEQLLEDIKLIINRKTAGSILVNEDLKDDVYITLTCVRTSKELTDYNSDPISTDKSIEMFTKAIEAMVLYNREDKGDTDLTEDVQNVQATNLTNQTDNQELTEDMQNVQDTNNINQTDTYKYPYKPDPDFDYNILKLTDEGSEDL